jgi:hypothetical protein
MEILPTAFIGVTCLIIGAISGSRIGYKRGALIGSRRGFKRGIDVSRANR